MTSTERPGKSPDEGAATDTPRRRRTSLVVTTMAAVLIAGGGGAYLAAGSSGDGGADGGGGTSSGDGNPPPLALDSAANAAERAPEPSPPPGIAPGEPDPNGVTYRAGGTLPDGPAAARVYRTDGTVGTAEVTRLAKALGVAGTPVADGTAWKVGSDQDGAGPLLRVEKQAPGSWTFTRFTPSPGGDNCLKGKECPSGGGVAPGDEGDAVSEAVAKKAAAPVLKALGQDDAKLDTRQLMGAVRVVNADPVVGGLPTYGWSTGIQVGADGTVAGGSGQLKAPGRADSYPVIGADAALAELNRAAGGNGSGVGGCATVAPLEGAKPSAPCVPASGRTAEPLLVDQAAFGLALRTEGGRPALVPSWLFRVVPGGEAAPYTVTQTAVAPEYLANPPVTPPVTPPHEESPGGPGGGGITSYTADGKKLSLRFWGGVCATYGATADEGGTAVKVKVTTSAPAGGKKVCVMIAKEQTVSVTLDKPLGDRRVVEATTGERVPMG